MGSDHELVSRRCHSNNQTPFCVMLVANASHHLQQKAERGTSGAFCCPSARDCYAIFHHTAS